MNPRTLFSIAYLAVSILPINQKGKKFAAIALARSLYTLFGK